MTRDGATSSGAARTRFDAEAATWEDKPERAALTAAILRAIRAAAPLQRDERVLEYGCGTAALARALSPDVGDVVAMDASEGMVREAARRVAAEARRNVHVLRGDLTLGDPPPAGTFDRIVCAMALHHVEDVAALLTRLAGMLRPGGVLAVADLASEDGSFHGDEAVPHAGFGPADLAARAEALGLVDARWVQAHAIRKHDRDYPVFLLTARRPRLKVLFLCTGNSCRSQMAEGWARALKGRSIDAYSAGIETHGLNPLAVKAMAEAGVDISTHRSKTVSELGNVAFDLVVTVCGHANEHCPLFPGRTRIVHAGFDDPPRLAADARTESEALPHYRRVRDEIRALVERLPEGGTRQ